MAHVPDVQMPADCLTKWLPSAKLRRSVEYMTGARVAATANASEIIGLGAIESAIANVSDIGHGASAGASAHVSDHPQRSNRYADPVGGSVVGGAGQMGNRDIIRIVVVLAARRDISYPDRQTVSPTPIRIVPHSSYSPLLTSILSTLNKRF